MKKLAKGTYINYKYVNKLFIDLILKIYLHNNEGSLNNFFLFISPYILECPFDPDNIFHYLLYKCMYYVVYFSLKAHLLCTERNSIWKIKESIKSNGSLKAI